MRRSARLESSLRVILAFVLAGFAGARTYSTYAVFSQTVDEPAHLGAGMEWLERGRYTFEPMHPPLARVAIALGPFLAGDRMSQTGGRFHQGNDILHTNGQYTRNLTLGLEVGLLIVALRLSS